MSLEPNKAKRSSPNRPASLPSAGGLKDFAKLIVPFGSKPLFRPSHRRRRHRPGIETLDHVFQGLLKKANRELATLLHEVHAGPDGALLDGAEGHAIRDLLRRALQCATKQYMLQTELGNLALQDELTGLYNRRGFLALAERQLKLARRSGRSLLLFFIDVNGLKEINDVFGHNQGDAALKCTAEALEMTFRDSDVIARFGGDEFVALAIEASGQNGTAIQDRLTEYLNSASRRDSRYHFSVSLGAARFDPWSSKSVRELIAEADQAMYDQKRRRSTPRFGYTACDQS